MVFKLALQLNYEKSFKIICLAHLAPPCLGDGSVLYSVHQKNEERKEKPREVLIFQVSIPLILLKCFSPSRLAVILSGM